MRLVDKPHIRPMHCAAVPYIGATNNVRWVDTGSEMPGFDNHVYLSEPGIQQAMQVLGYPSIEDYEQVKAQARELEEKFARLAEAYDELMGKMKAIEALETANFTIRRKTGRPPTEKVKPHEKVVN